jgi:hypothetical protein
VGECGRGGGKDEGGESRDAHIAIVAHGAQEVSRER